MECSIQHGWKTDEGAVAPLALGGNIRPSVLGRSTTCASQRSCVRCLATAPVSLHRGPTVAKARQGPEGTAGCAMSRTRLPPLGASASAGDSSVSSQRNRHLTRARPPHHARAPLLTGLLSPTWLSSAPAARRPRRGSASCRVVQGHHLAPPPTPSPPCRLRLGVRT
jgi:hypothetical protein